MKNTQNTSSAPLTIQIADQDFIRRASKLAARKGRKDVDEFIKEQVLLAARRAVGLDNDLSMGEVAQQLDCHLNTVKNYHRDGKFPHAYYRTPRCLRIPQKDVDALKKNTLKAAA